MAKSVRSKVRKKNKAVQATAMKTQVRDHKNRLHAKTMVSANLSSLDPVMAATAMDAEAAGYDHTERSERDAQLKEIRKTKLFKSRKKTGNSDVKQRKTKVGSYFKKKKK